MIKRQQQKQTLKRTRLHRLQEGSFIVFLILLSPLVFYSYRLFPNVQIWKTPFFTFESHGYQSVYTFAWAFIQKFTFLYLFIIWFLTNKNWWYHALMVPISMLVFQLITLLNWEFTSADEVEFYFMIPIIILVITLTYRIRKKYTNKAKTLDILNEIDDEIENIIAKKKKKE